MGDLGVDGRLIFKVILGEGDVKEMEYIKLFHVGDLGIDGRLILKVILREGDVKEMEYIKLFYVGSNSRLS